MFAVFVNMALVLVGSAVGLCTIGIGMSSLLGGKDSLCTIICVALGTILGEWLNIEKGMDDLGELLRRKLIKGEGNSRFVEGFVNATVLYCVGAMSINGAIAAGINGDYSILISKSVMDMVSSITFAAAMGIGVPFAVIPILLYEGGLTLLAGVVGPYLSAAVITEMSAVGGAIIVGIGLNLLGASKEGIRVSNMLPAIFLPIAYVPLANWVATVAAGLF